MKPVRISWAEIRKKVEEFRKNWVKPVYKVPVPIIEIVELDLGIDVNPIAGLQSRCDLDAFLERDLSTICIDHDLYMETRQENRLRFTLAHELGHLVLHKEEIRNAPFGTEEEWIVFAFP